MLVGVRTHDGVKLKRLRLRNPSGRPRLGIGVQRQGNGKAFACGKKNGTDDVTNSESMHGVVDAVCRHCLR